MTYEFLGRKIKKREITLVSVIILIHPLLILLPSRITLAFFNQLAGNLNRV
ncbi:potassium-transporting ATPase subunit KdpA [Nostoc sp.]|uniref:potassium-transporting ATPase subunit KdpA n=1 Tax=Nostoc sp. TaxID=1180 RepID=UPI003FA55E79